MPSPFLDPTVLLAGLALLANPFWQTKPPAQWEDVELQQFLSDSPWAQLAVGPGKAAPADGVLVFFATASPIEQAERERERRLELRRRSKQPAEIDPLVEEYRVWLEENRATHVVVAVRVPSSAAFSDEREVRRMESDSTLQIGRKKLKMTGHFPPSSGDPYLRLAFLRQTPVTDKSIVLDLYLPGVSVPYRQVQFNVKDMLVNGQLEY